MTKRDLYIQNKKVDEEAVYNWIKSNRDTFMEYGVEPLFDLFKAGEFKLINLDPEESDWDEFSDYTDELSDTGNGGWYLGK